MKQYYNWDFKKLVVGWEMEGVDEPRLVAS
jgi:hypothetical protein